MSQQLFTEVEAGKRYAVVTVEWFYGGERCQEIIAHTGQICLKPADFTCIICGKPVCELHEALGEHFYSRAMCVTCGKLTPAEREKVHQFRLEMNK